MAGKNRDRKVKKEMVKMKSVDVGHGFKLRYPERPFTVNFTDGRSVEVGVSEVEIIHDFSAARVTSKMWIQDTGHDLEAENLSAFAGAPLERRYASAVRLATSWFGAIDALVPKRIADEEIGDALEQIAQFVKDGRPPWQVYAKFATSAFWVLVHALGDISSLLRGKAK